MNLREIGRFGKPHGTAGEVNAMCDVDPAALSCIFVNVDGIEVPFFLTSVRTKGADGLLMKIDGCDSQDEARKMFVNKTIFALAEEVDEAEERDDDDGLYASDLIGFRAVEDTGDVLGEIVDIDDNTANVLFVIQPSAQTAKPLFVPVADEFIKEIDEHSHTVTFSLPEGLKEL